MAGMMKGMQDLAGAQQPEKAAAPAESFAITDITQLVDKRGTFCLNEDAEHTLDNLFMGDERLVLRSDADEQLLLHVAFTETVKLHSINITAPAGDAAPTVCKIYINQVSMDFTDCDSTPITQQLELTAADLAPESVSALRFVKFQRVSSITLFFEDNNGAEETDISGLKFFGTPLNGTNMADFKAKC